MDMLNLGRGLRRAWVVASLAWIALVTINHFSELREDLALVSTRLQVELTQWTEPRTPVLDTPFGQFRPSGELADFLQNVRKFGQAEMERRMAARSQAAMERLLGTLALMLGPPAALALLGLATGWVRRGFGRQ
jgi:hypothetical protein